MDEAAARLIEAVRRGDVEAVRSLLESGTAANARDDRGWTPLHWAAQEGHDEIARHLLRAGAIADGVDETGFSPLLLAVGEGQLGMVRLLLSHGVRADEPSGAHADGTPLHLAASWNHTAILKELLAAGAPVDAADAAGRTPLYFALLYGHEVAARLLIEASSSIDLQRRDAEEHKSLLDLSHELGNQEILGLLRSKGE